MVRNRNKSYFHRILYGLYRKPRGKMAAWGMAVCVFIALSADFIANDRPILCSYEGTVYYPVLRSYVSGSASPEFRGKGFDQEYDWAVWPPIRYGPEELHLERGSNLAPFTERDRNRHWLGTDNLGRDVLSGLIHGTRTALAIALLSMAIAFFIGVLLGIGAGYLGDAHWTVYPDISILGLVGGIGLIYAIQWATELPLLAIAGWVVLIGGYAWIRDKWLNLGLRKRTVPVDGTVLRVMELLRAIPDLFLLLAALAIMKHTGIIQIALLIGLLRWPSIARYVRAEVLKIRSAPFIEVARMQGKKTWRIMWTYLLPNAIGPALIAVVFGMSSAILIEAALSFLGIGLPASAVSWGSMMSAARDNLDAWWLALFPGMCIFLLIWILNQAADALLNELQTERLQQSPHF